MTTAGTQVPAVLLEHRIFATENTEFTENGGNTRLNGFLCVLGDLCG